ncbi:MAG: tRNA (N(6)-L-threonylcarbamoyladenosine(37)-C(2))-methylthiotransferase MtaB [Bacteroidota bacterium]
MNTVAFHTLGCKLNFAETSTIARSFKEAGWTKVDFGTPADVNIINTCSVTEQADRECKTIVHRALTANPSSFIAVTGCFAQLKPDTIAGIEGVDLVLGAAEKFNILKHLGNAEKIQDARILTCAIDEVTGFHHSWSSGDRTRVFMKVQDGCDYQCTFCTIPMARGKSRSNTIENVVNNIYDVINRGVREIVLTGVNLGDFGLIENADSRLYFIDLVNAIENMNGNFRVRISSIEPNLLTEEIIKTVAASQKFMPHFHIPLQSGSNKILKLMRRRYQRELYADRVDMIRSLIPHCSIGVDVITGFPGESESDFMETFNFLNDLDVSYFHVFTYSERNNTLAATMKDVVPVSERRERNKRLRNLSAKKLSSFYRKYTGTSANVLFEAEGKSDFMYGYSENYIRVKLPYDIQLVNQVVTTELGNMDDDFCLEGLQFTEA